MGKKSAITGITEPSPPEHFFRYVYVLYTRQEDRNGLNWGNYVVMATDQKIEPSERLHYHVSRFDPILTDADL